MAQVVAAVVDRLTTVLALHERRVDGGTALLDVYDEFDGTLVESFELYETNEPGIYFSDWLGRSTWLDCGYPDYTVDIVVYDTFEDFDVLTLFPVCY